MKTKQIPQVEFKVGSIKHIIPPINHFLNPKKGDWNWSRHILDKYPNLDKKLKNVKEISKRKKMAERFFQEFQRENKNELEKKTKEFQKEWGKINNKLMTTLSNILEINWPKKDKKIYAFVSLNPICPRYIKKRIFDVYYQSDISRMKGVAIHEVLHFLYFEKWKKVFPRTNEKEFDAPYLVWQLSEMVPKAILSDKRVQKVFKHKPSIYKEYLSAKINGRKLTSIIRKFYDNRKDFEDFLKKSWKFIQKHKKEINKI